MIMMDCPFQNTQELVASDSSYQNDRKCNSSRMISTHKNRPGSWVQGPFVPLWIFQNHSSRARNPHPQSRLMETKMKKIIIPKLQLLSKSKSYLIKRLCSMEQSDHIVLTDSCVARPSETSNQSDWLSDFNGSKLGCKKEPWSGHILLWGFFLPNCG